VCRTVDCSLDPFSDLIEFRQYLQIKDESHLSSCRFLASVSKQ